MEKAIAIKLLTDTLQKPFDEAQFRQFARNLLNDLDESKAFQVQGNYIKDAYKQQVRQYKRIGQYVDPDENTIDVLVVRLQQPTTLDRARTMQRNFIAQYLQDRDQKEAALVAYTTDGSPDWRFSLVRLDYRLEVQADGSYKPKKEVTAARRSSFLVGETEPNHTAQQQLLPLLENDRQNPTLDELEAAFNIESVTKEFFEQYKSLFLQVRDEVETLLQTDPVIATDFTQKQIDPANFAKKLLGQIVFLYFLQKKGWLGVEPGQPWGSGAKDFLRRLFNRDNVEYDNFFNDVLEPLFYQALAVDRGSEALYELPECQQPCKIPFLNGGLFEPIGGYDWQATNVLIANDTIQRILDTFDLYNFTVREDEPLDKEVAVDPEMLGKVFENLLEVSDRKSKGAFYTPREIVHYMCQESLINYLDTTVNRQSVELAPLQAQQTSLFEPSSAGQVPLTQEEYVERVPRKDLERLIRQGERAIQNDAVVVQKGSETPTYQFQVPESVRTYAAEIDRALAEIKICDPAIGSGAFPVGMMQEIVKVRGVLTTYLTLTPSPSPQGEGSKNPSPPTPLPRERGAGTPASLTPPSPQGEGGWGDEGDTVAGKLRQIPRALLERARELRSEQTPTEQLLWECLRDRRLNNFKFRRQHNIGQYIADFYCHEARLVIELDGGIHQTQIDRDRDRDAWMQSQGLRVLRFPNEQVAETLEVVLQTILDALTPSPSPNPLPGERASGTPPSLTPPSPQGEGGWGDEGRTPYAFKRHAIQTSIYGVDIDPGAVDIAKLRLWLSLVVDEDDYESIKPLPNLDYKIVCGNSLLSVEKNLFNHQIFAELEQRKQEYFEETNADHKAELRATIQGLIQTITNQDETFDFEVYFSEVFQPDQGGFDVVIGNPPYVRQEKLGKEAKQALKANFPELYKGTADIYTYFYGKGVSLLKEQGSLAYITSNKWFRANYGVPLRKYIAIHCQIHQIIDFGELPVFEAATFPVIFIAQTGTNHAITSQFTPVKSLNPPYPDIPTLVQQHGQALPSSAIQGSDWMLTSSGSANILKKMQQVGVPLGEYVKGQIFRGIITGFNKAFVINGVKRAELIAQDPKSAEIIKPLAVGDDVRKWHIRQSDKWLIVTPIGIEIRKYPAIFEHLSQWQPELEKRYDKGKHWWELRACDYYDKFDKPKIIYPEICKESRFAFDSSEFYSNNKAFIIPLDDLYLLGILNSSCAWEYTKLICSSLGDENKGGRLMLQWVNFKKLPIPLATDEEKSAIATLVQKSLDAQGKNVGAYEAEIGAIVARLYGLTEEELQIIRGEP